MLSIDHIEYGVQPYGFAVGYRMLGIYLKDDDIVYNFEGLDDDKDSEIITTMYSETAHKLFDELVEAIKKANLTEQWERALECKKLEYIGFIGNCFVDDYYFYPICMFQELISNASIQKQQLSEEFAKARAEHRMPRLQPPHIVLVADPVNPMFSRNIWEIGDASIGRLPVDKDENYCINSMANIANSPRGRFAFTPKSMEDTEKFEKYYPLNLFPKDEQLCVYIDAEGEEADKIAEWAMSKGFRHVEKQHLKTCINFDF